MKKILFIILFYSLVGCNLSHKEVANSENTSVADTLYLMFYHDKHTMHKFSKNNNGETSITYIYTVVGSNRDKWFEHSSLKDTVFNRSFDYFKKSKTDIWDPLRIVNRIVEEDFDVYDITSTAGTYSNPKMKRYFNSNYGRTFYIVEPDYNNKRLIITEVSLVREILM